MTQPPLSTILHDELLAIAQRVVQAFPDLRAEARQAAIDLLNVEGLPSTDPDQIYWHRFSEAASSSRTFTGWEHFSAPQQSLTLTELVMRRFRVSDQDNADLLSLYGGFYTAGPEAGRFDESNEVRLVPEHVLKAFWQFDFGAAFQRRAATFWKDYGDDVRTLAKLNYLSEALHAGLSGQLDEYQLKLVFDAVGFDSTVAPQLQHFEQLHSPSPGIQISTLSLGGQTSSDIIWLKGPGEQQVLYLPGSMPSFQGFGSEREVVDWLFGWLQVSLSQEHLLAHFTAESERLQALRGQFQGWSLGTVEQFAAQVQRAPITGELFTWMRDSAKQRMDSETDAVLRTNSELRVQLWIGYLAVAGRLFGYMAPVGWPIVLLAVAVGVASLALNIEQAVDGDNKEERHAAVLGAIGAGVELLLNLPFLLPLGRSFEPNLDDFEANEIFNEPPDPDGPWQGISTLANGRQYAEIAGVSYRVRYDQTMGTWMIVPEHNPYSFTGGIPIRLDEAGQWGVFEAACLRGGGQCLGGMRPEPAVELIDYSPFETVAGSYETPAHARPAMRELISVRNQRMISGDFYDPQSPLNDICESLERTRQLLQEDASSFFAGAPLQPGLRIVAPAPSLSPQCAFIQLFDEYQGLVVGESHGSIASKRWLMNNFRPLYDKGVRTLYFEHLMTDMHQADLDLFSRTGRMSRHLETYLRQLDEGHFTDPAGQSTFLELVRKARANRIQVQAIDCVASYRLDGLDAVHWGEPLRQKMMNFYAHQVITARQAANPADKWIALVGNTHSNFYKRVPGVAELQGVPGLRIVDAGPGQASGITLDPGEYFLPSMGSPDGIVQADLRLAIQTRYQPVEYLEPATAPPGVIRPRG